MDNNSFYSIDRLVEFGMSLAVAQQMTQTMNRAMQDMYVPGAMNPMQAPLPKAYHVVLDGQQAGPFSEDEMMKLISERRINKDTLAWMPGMPAWQPIEKMPQVLRLVALAPPPITNPQNPQS
ncbi:MAG: DUF4339 domain-containing protein [Bacteroidales bacterium]|nr:DUF4339 domain-containing protein [Bacteroidales bacterium]